MNEDLPGYDDWKLASPYDRESDPEQSEAEDQRDAEETALAWIRQALGDSSLFAPGIAISAESCARAYCFSIEIEFNPDDMADADVILLTLQTRIVQALNIVRKARGG